MALVTVGVEAAVSSCIVVGTREDEGNGIGMGIAEAFSSANIRDAMEGNWGPSSSEDNEASDDLGVIRGSSSICRDLLEPEGSLTLSPNGVCSGSLSSGR